MINVYLAEGFEEIEAMTIVDVLRRANCNVQTVAIGGDVSVLGTHEIFIEADVLFEDVDNFNCEMLVLPGGMPGANNLLKHEGLKEAILSAAETETKLAAICAAPMVLGAHGVLQGKRATIYDGMEDKLIGADYTGDDVTSDGGIITGRGPALAMKFALKLVEELKGKEVAEEIAKGLLF